MKDRYLYRGKCLANEEWVVGSLMQTNDGFYINERNSHSCFHRDVNNIPHRTFSQSHIVDKDTLCQCTGKVDKNKKLAFEGDLCFLDQKTDKYQIKWNEIHCCFAFFGTESHLWCDINNDRKFEIIGNIHEPSV
jgi:uncharacterized phage protein (TIGR01671 family)